jgi:hypothetical protein
MNETTVPMRAQSSVGIHDHVRGGRGMAGGFAGMNLFETDPSPWRRSWWEWRAES